MSYIRVIPRDLFNEANLLKCYGQVFLQLEKLNLPNVTLAHASRRTGFEVQQDQNDGSITIWNVKLSKANSTGDDFTLYDFKRPLNSREPWPLYLVNGDEDIPVFKGDDAGTFSAEMIAFLKG